MPPHNMNDSSSDEERKASNLHRAVTRRTLLTRTVAAVGMSLATSVSGRGFAATSLSSVEPTRVPGTGPRPYGARSEFERSSRLPRPSSSLTPLQDLHGVVTPSDLHFERHHNGVPTIDPNRHRLLIHGLVERPLLLTVDELKRFPSVSRLAFIECSGNSAGEWRQPTGQTAQQTHGLTSNSEWTGVALSTILREVGVRPEATWMLAEGSDAAAMTRSIPLAPVIDEALLCYGQNGEALRPEQGYPLRLLLPGWEGNTHIKWLRRLKLGTAPFMTREETSHYTDLMPDGTARQFTMVMEAKSVITSPSGEQRIQPGFVEIRGLAWSGQGRIATVDVSVDGGRTWRRASLQEPVLAKSHTRFSSPWRWDGQEAILQSRCTDESGFVQPARRSLVAVRGVNSIYHYNGIQSWSVSRDGHVSHLHED